MAPIVLSVRERARLGRELHLIARGQASAGASQRLYLLLRGKSAAEVLAILDGAVGRYATEAAAEIAAQMGVGSRAGARAALRGLTTTLRRSGSVPPGLAERAERWLARRIAEKSYRVSPLTGLRTARVSSEGTVWLSRALHRRNLQQRGVIGGLRQAITRAVKEGETATSLAQRMRDEIGHRVAITPTGPGSVRVPRELIQMEQSALRAIRAPGDPATGDALAKTRRAFARYRDRLRDGKLGTRSAARSALAGLESAVKRGSEEAVDRAVKWWTWNREQEHQRLIARTETARAYNAAYVEGSRAVPWVSGWTWVADSDPCEECADLDGRFIARSEAGPLPPLHPNCECHLEEVIDEDAQPSEEDWQRLLEQ